MDLFKFVMSDLTVLKEVLTYMADLHILFTVLRDLSDWQNRYPNNSPVLISCQTGFIIFDLEFSIIHLLAAH